MIKWIRLGRLREFEEPACSDSKDSLCPSTDDACQCCHVVNLMSLTSCPEHQSQKNTEETTCMLDLGMCPYRKSYLKHMYQINDQEQQPPTAPTFFVEFAKSDDRISKNNQREGKQTHTNRRNGSKTSASPSLPFPSLIHPLTFPQIPFFFSLPLSIHICMYTSHTKTMIRSLSKINARRAARWAPQVRTFSASGINSSSSSSSNDKTGTLNYGVVPKDDFGEFSEYSVIFTNRSLNLMSNPFQQVMRDLNDVLKTTYNADKVAIIPGYERTCIVLYVFFLESWLVGRSSSR